MKAVLVVDANEMLCRLTCDILRTEGYRAVPAYNAGEALEALGRENFDVLVTDVRTEGMSGLELARVIHDRNPQLPVILMTAHGPVEGRGIKVCLPKAKLFPGLLEKIRWCLSEGEVEQLHPR